MVVLMWSGQLCLRSHFTVIHVSSPRLNMKVLYLAVSRAGRGELRADLPRRS